MSGLALLSALTMGLVGGTHCIVMCGGVTGVLCSGIPASARGAPVKQLAYVLSYNAGRIATYALGGAIAGVFGSMAADLDSVHGAQVGLRFFAGALMLGLGLYLAGVWRKFSAIERLGAPLWRLVEPTARRLLPVRSLRGALGLGLLWGWMPCGLVYAALGLAITEGSIAGGAAVMVAFGLGTLPVLVAMGTLATAVARLARRTVVRRAAGVVIVCFGLVTIVSASAQAARGAAPRAHECCAQSP